MTGLISIKYQMNHYVTYFAEFQGRFQLFHRHQVHLRFRQICQNDPSILVHVLEGQDTEHFVSFIQLSLNILISSRPFQILIEVITVSML